MDAQALRAETFKALHERDRAFVMPNPLGRRLCGDAHQPWL